MGTFSREFLGLWRSQAAVLHGTRHGVVSVAVKRLVVCGGRIARRYLPACAKVNEQSVRLHVAFHVCNKEARIAEKCELPCGGLVCDLGTVVSNVS